MGTDGRALCAGTVPMVRTKDGKGLEPIDGRAWERLKRGGPADLDGPASTDACVRRITAPVSREQMERMAIHSALTDEKPIIAKLEKIKVPPRPNGWIYFPAALIGIALMGAGAVIAFFSGLGLLVMAAGPAITAGSLLLHEHAANRSSKMAGEKARLEGEVRGIGPSTREASRMLEVSVKTIELVREMPLEMEIKEKLLRALAGGQDAETEAAKIASLLEEAKTRGEDLEFWSRNALPQLIEKLRGERESI